MNGALNSMRMTMRLAEQFLAFGGARLVFRRDGLLASDHLKRASFIRSRAGLKVPDLQFYFPVADAESRKELGKAHVARVLISSRRSPGRGRVRLRALRSELAGWVVAKSRVHGTEGARVAGSSIMPGFQSAISMRRQ
ncbi:MAG: hypothetical protein OXN84_08290 [Albidovulum sp.]|nr:hypothetical protein [Albidovulum sp.]